MILHCDNHVLVAVKPCGLSTQQDTTAYNFTDQMKEWVKQKFHKPGAVFLEPVHRLDKAASGLVLFARTSKALSRLQEQMRGRQMKKRYLALVEGVLALDHDCLIHPLIHDAHRARVADRPEAKSGELHYRVLARHPKTTLVDVELITGRYHQIRAQMAHIGYPLCGDTKYGASLWKKEGIALHHVELSFAHPVTKQELSFRSEPSWLTV